MEGKKDNIKSKDLYRTYEKAREGWYCCATCQHEQNAVQIKKDGDRLPECKTCGVTYWYHVVSCGTGKGAST